MSSFASSRRGIAPRGAQPRVKRRRGSSARRALRTDDPRRSCALPAA